MAGLLEGKRILVTGIITDSSIAFHIAKVAQEQGAELVLTGFDRMKLIQRIADRLPNPAPLLELDVQNEEHLASLASRIAEVIVLNRAVSDSERQAIEEYLMRSYGIRSTTVAVDDFRCFPVAGVLDRNNSAAFPVEFDPDTYYEAQVSFDVSTQDPTFASFIRVTDSEARSLSTAISQAKNALPNAQRLVVDDLLVTDAYSAAGIAAAYASYFAPPRSRLRIAWLAPGRVPKVGERVFHRDNRVPELADRNPIHLLVGVKVSGGNVIEVITERQNDFVSDRLSIAASDDGRLLIAGSLSSSVSGSAAQFT